MNSIPHLERERGRGGGGGGEATSIFIIQNYCHEFGSRLGTM